MHTPTLPIPPAIASARPAPASGPQRAKADAGQFSQTLSREMEQHRAAPAARPQGAGAAKEVAGTPAKAGDDTVDDKADKADAHAAAAISPVTDMLALVASFNLPAAPAAPASEPPAAGVATQVTTQVAAQLSAPAGELPAGAGKTLVADGDLKTSAAVAPFAMAIAGAVAAPDAQPKQPKLAAPTAPADSTARAAAQKPDADGGVALAAGARSDAAPVHVREAVTDVAALKEPAAPVQPATLAMVQAMALSGAPADKIAARVGTPGWDAQVGQKIIWMVAGKEQTASLTLSPPDLGPMQVVLSVTNDQATVTFTAAQPEVRQALEAAMPKLREMMGESGIALGNATVSAGTPDGRQAQQGEQPHGKPRATRFADAAPISLAPAREGRLSGGSGMVDTFA